MPAVTNLAQGLAAMYGTAVQVRMVDLNSSETPNYPEVVRMLSEGKAARPVVAVDGRPIHAGGFSMAAIAMELDKMGVPRLRP